MLRYKECGIGILAVLMVCTTTNAVKPEKNSPGYLTDGHGVLQALLTVVDDFPEAEPYIESTIRWLFDVRIEMKGGYVWRMSTTAPKGHQSYGLRPSVSFQLAVLSLRAHQRKPNELYIKVANGAMDLFFNHVEGYYRKTEFGEGVFFPAYFRGRFGIILETRPIGVSEQGFKYYIEIPDQDSERL